MPRADPVRLIGPRAWHWLTGQAAGTILAVVTRAAYLQDRGGEIFWVAGSEILHPRVIVSDLDPAVLSVGMPFHVVGRHLYVADHWVLALAGAEVAQPPPVLPPQPASPEQVKALARQVIDRLAESDRREDAGSRLPFISVLAAESPPGFSAELFSPTLGSIHAVAHACLSRDLPGLFSAARGLVGLGPGLTPSGDDFLGGLLFCAHHLCATFPLIFPWDDGLIGGLLEWARAQTHVIAYTLLGDHARGEGAFPMYGFLTALLEGQNSDALSQQITRVSAIGSSTGSDLLAGMLAAALLLP